MPPTEYFTQHPNTLSSDPLPQLTNKLSFPLPRTVLFHSTPINVVVGACASMLSRE